MLSSFSKKRMTPSPCSEAPRNQVQNKEKEEISHTVGISLMIFVTDANSLYRLYRMTGE